ncbi:UNVERIFIED_CONTAM: hypothetical protein FKN15_041121 [Acipenser sinensis]
MSVSAERSTFIPPGQGYPPSAVKEVAPSSSDDSVPRKSRRIAWGKSPRRKLSLQTSSSSSAAPSPPPRKRKRKSHRSKGSADSEQLEKLWAAVSHQGTVFAELLREREEELVFSSEEVDSDSALLAVNLFLSAELLPLIKRATAILQVPWLAKETRKQSIFEDEPALSPKSPQEHHFLYEVPSSWGQPATALAVLLVDEDGVLPNFLPQRLQLPLCCRHLN